MQPVGPLSFSEGLARRLAGPFPARFVLQPLAAIILGIRDGIADAKLGRPPFVVALLFATGGAAFPRRELLRTLVSRILIPLAIGIVLDAIVQWYLFHRVIVWSAILVGVTLVGIPYSIARGLTNRFVTNRNKRRRGAAGDSKPRRVA